MPSVIHQITAADKAICNNITILANQRALLSQNILAQLRNLVEGVAVLLYTNSYDTEYNHDIIKEGLKYVKSRADYSFLVKFHNWLQQSSSHYTFDDDSSERLMLKYYEYMYRMRNIIINMYRFTILSNLERFPVDLDPALREYHEKIASRIDAVHSLPLEGGYKDRYYIHKTRPFFVHGRIYYEVTIYRAVNKVSKFDRIIAFTDMDIMDKHAALLTLHPDSILVLNRTMPIVIIRKWEVSIRPCEFNNFARIMGDTINVQTNSKEYQLLMRFMTDESKCLLDLIDLPDEMYAVVKNKMTAGIKKPLVFPVLDMARQIIKTNAPGHNRHSAPINTVGQNFYQGSRCRSA
jgi:hypothetical protein